MRPRKLTLLLLPFCAISLTACQSAPQVQTQVTALPPPEIPAVLLLPTSGPHRPGLRATQRDAALVIEDFTEALASCNADKAAIAAIWEEYERGNPRPPD